MKFKKIISVCLALLMFIPILQSASTVYVSAITISEIEKNKTEVYNFFKNTMKVNDAVICGVLANIEKESDFNPGATYTESNGSVSYGICQWNSGRRQNLESFCKENGYDASTLTGQLNFLKFELEGTEKAAWRTINSVKCDREGAYVAGYHWARYFERCASVYYTVRAELARDEYWQKYGNGNDSGYKKITEGIYYILNPATDKYLTVDGGADANRANVSVESYNGTNAQAFEIKAGKFGYTIRPLSSGTRVVNVYGNYVTDGCNVCLWDKTGDSSQLWFFEQIPNTDGCLLIRNAQNQNCAIDLWGVNAGVYPITYNLSQMWLLQTEEEVEASRCSHDEKVIKGALEPTCTEAGYTGDLVCAKCGEVFETGEIISPLGHQYESSEILATPETAGYTKYFCPLCGNVYTEDEVEYSPETYPTVKGDSVYTERTKTVNVTLSAENFPAVSSFALSDINFDSSVMSLESVNLLTDGTLSESDGVYTASFASPVKPEGEILSLVFTVSESAPDGIYPVEYKFSLTYPAVGGEEITLDASAVSGTIEVGPCRHEGTMVYVESKEPGCTENGSEAYYTCTSCSLIFRDAEGKEPVTEDDIIIPATGHDYEKFYTVDTAPTETEPGSRSRHCKGCGDRISVTPMPPYCEIQKGDYNGDGYLNMSDVMMIRQYALGIFEGGDWLYIEAADTNGDGVPTIADAMKTRQAVLGLIIMD